jgi:hypothetical protein
MLNEACEDKRHLCDAHLFAHTDPLSASESGKLWADRAVDPTVGIPFPVALRLDLF